MKISKRVRNQILALGANLGLLLFIALPAYALDWDITDPFAGLSRNPCKLVEALANMLVGFVVAAGVFFLAWGGIQYMQSGGDKMAVQEARGKITGAITGILVGFGGYFIIRVILYVGRGTFPGCVEQLPPAPGP